MDGDFKGKIILKGTEHPDAMSYDNESLVSAFLSVPILGVLKALMESYIKTALYYGEPFLYIKVS